MPSQPGSVVGGPPWPAILRGLIRRPGGSPASPVTALRGGHPSPHRASRSHAAPAPAVMDPHGDGGRRWVVIRGNDTVMPRVMDPHGDGGLRWVVIRGNDTVMPRVMDRHGDGGLRWRSWVL